MVVIDRKGRQVRVTDRNKTAEARGGAIWYYAFVWFTIALIGLWLLQYLPFDLWPVWMV